MIYLELFWSFLKIGAISFGGGYGMISAIREAVISHKWMTEGELLNFIAVAESTPGPIAVNMATFVGASQGGVLGSMVATIGVVMPSFFIILIIAAFIKDFLKYKGVNAFLSGIRPCIVAMILATATITGLSVLLSFSYINDTIVPDVKGIIILFLIVSVHIMLKRFGKNPSPIIMILISAGMGILFY